MFAYSAFLLITQSSWDWAKAQSGKAALSYFALQSTPICSLLLLCCAVASSVSPSITTNVRCSPSLRVNSGIRHTRKQQHNNILLNGLLLREGHFLQRRRFLLFRQGQRNGMGKGNVCVMLCFTAAAKKQLMTTFARRLTTNT